MLSYMVDTIIWCAIIIPDFKSNSIKQTGVIMLTEEKRQLNSQESDLAYNAGKL